jgi:hypothetical protein
LIIKRRYTKRFVTLENELVRDRRLSLDEHGMLHYLLSLPDDWEVSQAQCAKFWRIGREKCNRIFRNLARYGWAQMETIRTDDNSRILRVQWIINDEPGEIVTDEALLDEASRCPETDNQDAENQQPDNLLPENPLAVYIDSTKTESEENRLSQRGADENLSEISGKPIGTFADLIKLWPADNVLSRSAAEQAWERKGRAARQAAFDLVLRYLADCRSSSRKVCDLTTYLREDRHERFAPTAAAGAATVAIRPDTPQWHRWRDYRLVTGQSVKFMDAQAAKGGSFTVPSEWPPAMPPRPEGAPSADTGPPPEMIL